LCHLQVKAQHLDLEVHNSRIDLQKDYEVFDWVPLDKKLDAIATRGHQGVFAFISIIRKRPMVCPIF
jgi:hypothetical protein